MTWANAKIKRIYVWENLVRPVWKPWSNTIMYLPLEKDWNDYSGNNHNLTWSWTPAYTISWWTKQVTSFNGSTLWMINSLSWSYTNYTFNVRAKPTSYSNAHLLWNANASSWQDNIYLTWCHTSYPIWWNHDFGFQYRVWSWSYTVLYWTANRTLNAWYNFCVIGSSSWVTWYVNGTQIFTTSASSAIKLVSWQNDIWWFYRIDQWTKWDYFNWYMSEFIFENKTWTAQEISEYYNDTKSKYWL